jgi:transposase
MTTGDRVSPGIGPVCARTLRLALPALGPLTRQPIAAVGGGAPLHDDRGTLRGRRTIWGGRAPVRPVVDMGTRGATRFNPQIKVFYQRLLAAGKRKKVALTACRHKLVTMLNALLKQRTSWQAGEVQNYKRYQAPLTTKTVAPLVPRCGYRRRLRPGVRVLPKRIE